MTTIRKLQRLVHVGCRELRIDADTRRDLQIVTTGKASLSEMTEAELGDVVAQLVARGFRPSGGQKPRRPQAARADVRYCHVLWRLLAQAGKVDTPGPAGLNAFIRARFAKSWGAAPIDVDALTDHGQINAVIKALQAMCDRAGIVCRQAR
ncbi:regulatory protein GemA [Paracoccus sp. (in: a-proteobacteria)]|uniref:regulatory protein GemA n=1 Tax=Paracoccus sp. TaxID=267 RepID=UPI0026DF69A0|nr:regulatory protein GemA [Paracoccus sp. (in: a-proteobacteria)]MDO5648844.1 regulatory protein GemA [Paracoccus sp. (in: a-proteobacteria)]